MKKIIDLPEKDLIARLLSERTQFRNAFGFVLGPALDNVKQILTIECYLSVNSSEFGLESGSKPGDIDVLLIPVVDGCKLINDIMAVEVKKLPIPIDNRGRSPSSFGTSQARGASKMGFPFTGLLHIPIIEKSKQSDLIMLPVVGTAEAGKWLTPEQMATQNTGKTIPIDPDFVSTIFRTIGRFEQFDLPSHVGYHSHGIQTNNIGDQIESTSVIQGRSAKRNPVFKQCFLEKLQSFEKDPDFVFVDF